MLILLTDLLNFDDCPDIYKQRSISDTPVQPSETVDRHCLSTIASKTSPVHSCLFSSDFVSVDNLGNVLILSVPSLPSTTLKQSDDIYLKCPKKDSGRFLAAAQRSEEACMPFGGSVQQASAQTRCLKSEAQALSTVFDFEAQQNEPTVMDMKDTEMENPIGVLPDGGEGTNGTPEALKDKEPFPLASVGNDDEEDTELSPRLTNYMESGVVPESPINGITFPNISLWTFVFHKTWQLEISSDNINVVGTMALQENQMVKTKVPSPSQILFCLPFAATTSLCHQVRGKRGNL